MALQSPFFGKREAEPLNPRPTPPAGSSSMALPSSASASTSSAGSSPLSGVGAPADSRAATAAAVVSAAEAAAPSASKLTVGPNIKLKGVEITDCDTLVVEGLVEATMDSRVIHIAEQGAFKGSAEIDIAEIHGSFDGTLTVRDKLVIHATGKVTGTVRYGKLVVEEGGQLSGEITFGFNGAARSAGSAGSGNTTTGAAAAPSYGANSNAALQAA
ncbi:bactofilin family protein [Xylophilus ampelinus]|uniref:Cytoskeletal protein CcmA (Bactofilin family) n=1 Tax=Xylophilus ampelinus TaxID=54067 RepID=A0A318SHX0_9BURK|nr:polymer-forming cytoskeletal protein [Xylophilus ampelinus]MCS4509997.1 polymer-forming cytoskeletal protein [Xylophilus ampelinus]PYE78423.1 cytoskeletal protein CcmA (bactofilin family) [Xylophilus ampelinus]